MKKFAAIAATIMLATGLTAPMADAKPRLTGEAKLAKMLEGRVAGKPVSCIPLGSTNSTIIDGTAIVYHVGNTYYVNRPTNPEQLNDNNILVTKTSSSQLCRLDIVQLRDRSAPHIWNGFVGLQDFVPYRKAKTASR